MRVWQNGYDQFGLSLMTFLDESRILLCGVDAGSRLSGGWTFEINL